MNLSSAVGRFDELLRTVHKAEDDKQKLQSALVILGYPVAQLVEALRGRPRVRSPMGSLAFSKLFFNPPGRTMGLESTQPLTGMIIRDIYCRVRAAGAWGCQTCHLHVPIFF